MYFIPFSGTVINLLYNKLYYGVIFIKINFIFQEADILSLVLENNRYHK